jgi:hypothetical protein
VGDNIYYSEEGISSKGNNNMEVPAVLSLLSNTDLLPNANGRPVEAFLPGAFYHS